MGSSVGGFVNAALLWGAALASIPLIIHLLNRQRHKPMAWGAMRFVLAAYKKTRRRVQMENLLLLLLRMAAILLLAFALARPFTGRQSPLAGLTESRRDVIIVLDGSASMGYRESVETVFERAVARARAIVRDLDGGRGDRVRLILAGAYPRLLSWTQPERAAAMLDTLSVPTDEGLDLSAALGEVLRLVREDASGSNDGTLEIRLLTDAQRRSFAPSAPTSPAIPSAANATSDATGDDAQQAGGLAAQLDEIAAAGLSILVEDLGPGARDPANTGIESVQPLGPLLGAGLPADVRVEVQNFGTTAKGGVRVALEVDGERRPLSIIDVPARGRAEAVFPVVFKSPGEHVLAASLEGDHLLVDDARTHVIHVPSAVRVLLVNGAPSALIEEDETGYLKAVLEPPESDDAVIGGPAAPFEPREIDPDLLTAQEVDLAAFDVIWLANVESVSAAAVERLEHAVAGGTALIVSLGDRVTPESYNARLFRADGSGLLPAELKRRVAVASRRETYYRVKTFDAESRAFAFFADDRWKPLLTEVPIYEFFAAKPIESARTLATIDDEGSSPLLVERAYDRGHVLLWTTTIDPAWTRLPESPRTLVPFVHELLRYATRADEPPRNVAPGEPLSAEVATFPHGPELVRPDGSRRALDGESEALGNGRFRLPQVPAKETERIGAYKIELAGAAPLSFAVQLDAGEGDLLRLAGAELEALHRAFVPVSSTSEGRGRDDATPPQRGELWRGIAAACLAALVLESLWAAWLGKRRNLAR
ncbi:MAG: BatA domain-containing protein [Planctomycetota bacterium]